MNTMPPEGSPQEEAGESPAVEAQEADAGMPGEGGAILPPMGGVHPTHKAHFKTAHAGWQAHMKKTGHGKR